jgi:RNA recognition motif-containing protein
MKLYVGNMPFSMDEAQLRSLFGEFGTVESADIITNRATGRPRGFAFVEMEDTAARKAMCEFGEREIDGRKLKVAEARPRENRDDRGHD